MARIAFLGLGVMGAPMARNLAAGGHAVTGFDVDSRALRAAGVATADSAAEAARDAEIVITMLPKGEHVKAALFGDRGASSTLPAGAMIIDMSTVQPLETDEIARAALERGHRFVDAPVGRSSQHAIDGTLLIMAGGEAADVEAARPVLALMGDPIVHCGGRGTGARAKIVNNYMSIVSNVVVAESLVLAEASGLDRQVAIDICRGTTAGQGHLNTTWPAKVLKGDTSPGFMIDLAHKDLLIGLELAARLGAPSACGAAARPVYEIARAKGRGRDDWTAMLEVLQGEGGSGDRSGGGDRAANPAG
ncbi:MAG: sulfolactaldehyde 3-reductase [Geminicoccaceae bacterium]|nr:sulfolactaldehyde 3-reductase [Geminicoccaceae bacterium]